MLVDVNPTALLQGLTPVREACHCTVGGGAPPVAAQKVTDWPGDTDWLMGWTVISGATAETQGFHLTAGRFRPPSWPMKTTSSSHAAGRRHRE